ncbi:hypothetical protein [Synechococcus elongatus]|uniref:hypothetical protein n=1 Tax=Synechococcus elongatus TaxID=32046 RepID=UPI000F7E9BDF|nr:hypothetical protein [Synechococcus elongatus]
MNESILTCTLTSEPEQLETFVQVHAEVRPAEGTPTPIVIKALNDRKPGQFLLQCAKGDPLVVAGLIGTGDVGVVISPRNCSRAVEGAYLNLVLLTGNAGKDPQKAPSGKAASILMIVNQTEQIAYPFNIVALQSERIDKLMEAHKGARLEVVASLSSRYSEEKQRIYYDLLAQSIRLLSRGRTSTDGKNAGAIEANEPDMDGVDFL